MATRLFSLKFSHAEAKKKPCIAGLWGPSKIKLISFWPWPFSFWLLSLQLWVLLRQLCWQGPPKALPQGRVPVQQQVQRV
jgi:hypothetical protein